MINDLGRVYKRVFKKTKNNLKHLPLLAIELSSIFFIFYIVNMLTVFSQTFSPIMGVVRYFVRVLALSSLFSGLQSIIEYDRLKMDHFLDFSRFFNHIVQYIFVLFIIDLLVQFLSLSGIVPGVIVTIISTLIVAITSPAYEMIYIDEYGGYNIFTRLIPFFRENWFNWIGGLLISLLINYLITYLQSIAFLNVVYFIIATIILSFVIGVLILIKGNLYDVLAHSSRRKRDFEDKFNE